jgi:hypothetical protein
MKLTFRDYLDYSERSLESAQDDDPATQWLLIPATILAWSAIESFVNNILDDFSSLDESLFELHERSLLLEQRLKFVNQGENIGQFVLEGKEYRRLDDKIFFLIAKFGGQKKSMRGESLWQKFELFKDTRDALVHPRRDKEVTITKEMVQNFIETAKSIIQLISRNVWKKGVSF